MQNLKELFWIWFCKLYWAFPENNRAGGVEDLFFQKIMLTPCDVPLVTPCDSRFRYPTLVTTTIYPCDRPKYQHFTLVTKLITTFTLVTKYRSSRFFSPCDKSKTGIFTLVTWKFSTFTLVTKIGPPPPCALNFWKSPIYHCTSHSHIFN